MDLGYCEEKHVIDTLMECVPRRNRESDSDVEEREAEDLESMVDVSLLQKYTLNFCKEHQLMPIRMDVNKGGKQLSVAMLDPRDLNALHELRFVANVDITPLQIDPRGLRLLWKKFYNDNPEEEVEDRENKLRQQIGLEAMLPRVNERNIPQFLDAVFLQAVNYKVSDIHMDPWRESVVLRFRIDGTLYPVCEMSDNLYKPLVSRVKILANMDISEHRASQEGRIELSHEKINRPVHLRVACIPTHFGERIAIRLLDSGGVEHKLESLGMEDKDIETFKRVLTCPRGIILITGPTGSGKTTTLY